MTEIPKIFQFGRGRQNRAMPKDRSQVKVVSKCSCCGVVDVFRVAATGLKARRKGKTLAEAFPELPEARRKQLAEHVCPTCQEKGMKR
jgi:hypothetical protein